MAGRRIPLTPLKFCLLWLDSGILGKITPTTFFCAGYCVGKARKTSARFSLKLLRSLGMVPIIQTLRWKREKNIRHLAQTNTMMIGGGSCKKCIGDSLPSFNHCRMKNERLSSFFDFLFTRYHFRGTINAVRECPDNAFTEKLYFQQYGITRCER